MAQNELYLDRPDADFFCQGVRRGDMLFIAGQVGVDAQGHIPDALSEQLTIAYQNISAVLEKFNASMDDIVDETMFVTDMADCMANVGPVFAAREAAYGKKPEVAQTLIGTTALVDPAMKIEIKVIAKLA